MSTSTLCFLSTQKSQTAIKFNFDFSFESLAHGGYADSFIVSTEQGFSPLGAASTFLQTDLGISYDGEIRESARWNQDKNSAVSLLVYPSQRPKSILRGIVLAPGENCLSYARFAGNSYFRPKPHRDYYYSVSYEAISFLCKTLGARNIAISNLSASGKFHEHMAACHVEALGHFCIEFPDLAPESFTFCGCCISREQLLGAQDLVSSGIQSSHRFIKSSTSSRGLAKVITIDWSKH